VEVQCKTPYQDYQRMAMLGEFGDWEWFDRIPENVDAWGLTNRSMFAHNR
jgi:hypothetical protein